MCIALFLPWLMREQEPVRLKLIVRLACVFAILAVADARWFKLIVGVKFCASRCVLLMTTSVVNELRSVE